MAIRPLVYHVLALVGDNELMTYKIVNRWLVDEYSIIQQSPISHLVAKLIPSTKHIYETREIKAND